ncbi:MAG: nitrous oxide-stimulated promoter family protein, partial [Actinomycetia bacterium]|nr:nitrous oxide-stimulated promoter family protein [Actinomycetes bacterium]
EKMITLYCSKHHPGSIPCDECKELIHYSGMKLHQCRFGGSKPACSACSVHCYRPLMRGKIREVMKYSGPRLMYHHPVISIKYMINKMRRPSTP